MVDWSGYLDDLHQHLNAVYQIDDAGAVNLLLAALIDVPRTAGCWMILETDWLSRDCSPAWFAFGGTWSPESLGKIRAMRPRQANQLITQWREEPAVSRLFVEPDWQQLPRARRISEMPSLVARSLRVRVKAPRSIGALVLDQREQDRRADALAELVRRVLEDRIGARPVDPPRFVQPANFLYHAELLQRLAPWYPDWSELINALASLAIHHAYLFGRDQTAEEDWTAMGRVAADSVPVWIHAAIRYLDEHPAGGEESTSTPSAGRVR
jgi:hypothetical protein